MINSEDLTFANVLKAAWAYVLARHSATNDIVFGSLVHGRGQAGSQDVFGACVNIIPYRIIFGQNWTARYLLAAVAAQQLAHTPFESMGSQSIIRNCTNWAKWLFSSFVIIHQNFEQRSLRGRAVDFDSADMSPDDVDDVEVYVISTPGEDGMEILLSFNNQVVSQALAETMALDLSETITEFYTKMDAKLMSPNEIHDLRAALSATWCDIFFSTNEVPRGNSTKSLFDLGGDASTVGLLAAHMQRRDYRVGIEEVVEHLSWFQLLLHLSQQRQQQQQRV